MNIKLIIIIILFGLSGSLEAASADIVLNKDRNRAIEAYQKNNFSLAAQLLPPFAEQGDPESLYSLARMYENGWGVSKDLNKAINYYTRSAEQGHPAAKMVVSTNSWNRSESLPKKPAVVLKSPSPDQSSNIYGSSRVSVELALKAGFGPPIWR